MHPFVVLIYMREDYKTMPSEFNQIDPPSDLSEKIMSRLRIEKRRLTVKRRIFIFFLTTIVSITLFIPAFKELQLSVNESGFWQFSSLFFSDFKIVLTNWQLFSLSLLESLPGISLLSFLAVVLIFFESCRFLVKNIKSVSGLSINDIKI